MSDTLNPVQLEQLNGHSSEALCAWLVAHAGLKSVDLDRAQRLAQESPGSSLTELLTRLGLVSEMDLARSWASTLEAPLLAADAVPPPTDTLPVLSERFMRHNRLLPIGSHADGVHVLAANPANAYGLEAVRYACQTPVYLSVGLASEVDGLIERFYGQGRSAMGSLIETMDEHGGAEEDIEHLKDLASEAPVIRLVNLILQRAVEQDRKSVV